MPSLETNSVIIRPQPPRRLMKRRKTVSVIPAMGARMCAGRMATLRMRRVSNMIRTVGPLMDTPGFSGTFAIVGCWEMVVNCLPGPAQSNIKAHAFRRKAAHLGLLLDAFFLHVFDGFTC